jgi:hypothetical protein
MKLLTISSALTLKTQKQFPPWYIQYNQGQHNKKAIKDIWIADFQAAKKCVQFPEPRKLEDH